MNYQLTTDKLVIIATDDQGRRTTYYVADLQPRLTQLTTNKANDITKFNEQLSQRYDSNIALYTALVAEAATLTA
jgi:hypothetical protein